MASTDSTSKGSAIESIAGDMPSVNGLDISKAAAGTAWETPGQAAYNFFSMHPSFS